MSTSATGSHFLIRYKSLEGLASIFAGILASSVALVGFGIAGLIEVAFRMTLLWGLRHDPGSSGSQFQQIALRIVGSCSIALGLSLAYESISAMIRPQAPGRSIPGLIISFIALDVTFLVSKGGRRVDGQADLSACLPAILLGGLLSHAAFGWWWADPGAALLMAPIVAKEGLNGLLGKGRFEIGIAR